MQGSQTVVPCKCGAQSSGDALTFRVLSDALNFINNLKNWPFRSRDQIAKKPRSPR
jgi:hypothetical protein